MENKLFSRRLVFSLLAVTSLALVLVCIGVWWRTAHNLPELFGGKDRTAPGPPPPTLLRVCEISPSLLNAPLYVAQNLKLFDEKAVKVELTAVQDGPETLDAQEALRLLSANSVQVIVGSPDLTVRGVSQSPQVKTPVFAQLTNCSGALLLKRSVKTPSPNPPTTDTKPEAKPNTTPETTPAAVPFDWPDLKGKTVVSFPRGTIPDMALGCELKQHGLIPQKNVNLLENIPSQDLAAAFISGSGDYILAREPLASLLEAEETASIVTTVYGCTGGLPTLCAMTTEGFIRENPRVLQSYTDGLFQAQLWLSSHSPQEIASVLKNNFSGYSYDNLLKAVTRYKKSGVWSNSPLPEEQAFENLQQIMLKSGEVKATLPFKELAETKFAREAVSNKANLPGKLTSSETNSR